MSKLYRSLLWSGLVAAGVAACGDDVTVTPPPPPVLGVHSISVGPNPATIQVGTTLQMTASVNADAGVATTVTWRSTNTALATVSSTGLVTAVAAGTVAIEACSTFNTAVCGNATVIVQTAPVSNVTGVTVTPATATISKPQTGTATVQFSASVQGANNPAQTVTWSIVGAPAGVSVSSTGLVTITTAVTVATANISACSTVAGFTGVCGFAVINIGAITPATVSLNGVTWVPPAAPTSCTPGPGPAIPVVLTNVRCQIEITANVNAGDVQLSRMDVVMTNTCTIPPNTAANCVTGTANVRVMASTTFPGTVAGNGEGQNVSAPVDIQLSINTAQVRSPTNVSTNLVPAIFNGNATIQLVLYSAAGIQVASTNPTPVVMNNVDAVTYPTSLVATTNTPVGGFTVGGVTFFNSTQTISGAQYISFSQTVPTASGFVSTLAGCGPSTSTITGTPTTGILLGGVFACAGVQGSNTVSTAAVPAFTYAVATGPDGTPITPPTFYSTVGSPFQLPASATFGASSENRWNLLLQNGAPVPAPTPLPTVGVDRAAPVVTVQGTGICTAANGGKVAFNDLFDQCWVNAAYAFAQDISATDVGGSGVALLQAHDYLVGTFVPPSAGCSAVVKVTGNDYAETLVSDGSPDGWRICAFATDNVGNSASSGPSNWFGVDKVAPSVRLAGSTSATPTFASLGITFPGVSATPNTTIYSIASPFVTTDRWGLEAIDTRSGFNQNAVAGFPANETMTLLNPATNPAANVGCGFTNPLGTVLSDNWVRSSHIPGAAILDCGLGVPGYFWFNGFVTDRAGNASTTITRNYAIDQYAAPTLASVGASSIFYTAGQPAGFFIFGSDDLEIIEANLTLTYPGMNAITATLTGVTKPLSSITGCARWDATLCNILAGASAVDPYLFGRVDLTCSAATTPYASCAAADALPSNTAQFNNVDTDGDTVFEDDDKNPTAVSAVVFDVASQPSAPATTGLLTAQTNDVAMQWGASADIITWKIISTAGTTVVAEHKASTSITATYFDFVYLARANAGATALVVCAQFAQNPVVNPVLTDNGVNRFWTYTITKPTGTAPCATGGNWYAIGVKNGAALVTQGVP